MAEVHGAYKHGRNIRIWLKSYCIMSNVTIFAMQDERSVVEINTTDYIDPLLHYLLGVYVKRSVSNSDTL